MSPLRLYQAAIICGLLTLSQARLQASKHREMQGDDLFDSPLCPTEMPDYMTAENFLTCSPEQEWIGCSYNEVCYRQIDTTTGECIGESVTQTMDMCMCMPEGDEHIWVCSGNDVPFDMVKCDECPVVEDPRETEVTAANDQIVDDPIEPACPAEMPRSSTLCSSSVNTSTCDYDTRCFRRLKNLNGKSKACHKEEINIALGSCDCMPSFELQNAFEWSCYVYDLPQDFVSCDACSN